MNRNQTILIIVGILIIIGFIAGFSYWLGRESTKEVKEEKPGVLTFPESKVINQLSAYISGEIKEINNKTLVLIGDGKDFSIKISEEAEIKKINIQEEEKAVKELKFEDLKIGDIVTIQVSLNEEGKVEGELITVLP